MEDLRVSRGLVIPGAELRETASRSSGPGGQHVNTSSTRVTLRWNAAHSDALTDRQRARLLERLARRLSRDGELIVHAGRARSRARNREQARARLAERVRDALATQRTRVPTRPPGGARERRLSDKKRRATTKRQRGRPSLDD